MKNLLKVDQKIIAHLRKGNFTGSKASLEYKIRQSCANGINIHRKPKIISPSYKHNFNKIYV